LHADGAVLTGIIQANLLNFTMASSVTIASLKIVITDPRGWITLLQTLIVQDLLSIAQNVSHGESTNFIFTQRQQDL